MEKTAVDQAPVAYARPIMDVSHFPASFLCGQASFLVPVGLYWVLPDVMPFVPIDDIGVTLIVMGWFVARMERKYPSIKLPPPGGSR